MNRYGNILRASPPVGANGPGGRPPAGAYPGPASWAPVHPPPTASPRPPTGPKLADSGPVDCQAEQTSRRPAASLPSHITVLSTVQNLESTSLCGVLQWKLGGLD